MPLNARVIRPAPDFSWTDAEGRSRTLASLRGQPTIVLIAPSPNDRRFRAQIGWLQREYQRFAAAGLVCFAAFTEQSGTIPSNIPFVTVPDGPRVGFLYEAPTGFAIGVIGPDGNLDLLTSRVVPAQQILDVMNANFAVQERMRRP